MNFVLAADLVDPSDLEGRTYREISNAQHHRHPLGLLVELDVEQFSGNDSNQSAQVHLTGRCRLYVVGHSRDCDGTPLYVLSDIPVTYPLGERPFSLSKLQYHRVASLVLDGYDEDSLTPVAAPVRKLTPNIRGYFGL